MDRVVLVTDERPPPFPVSGLVARLERRVAFSLSVTDHELYFSIGADNLTGTAVCLNRKV